MRKITMAMVLGCTAGCATVASGPYGVPLDEHDKGAVTQVSAAPHGSLNVSAGELPALASPYFGAVEVTFENPTSAWVQIDRVDIDFGSAQRNQSVFVPWGDYIDAWRQAVVDLMAIGRANANSPLTGYMALQLMAVGGDEMAARDRGDDRRNGASGARGGVVVVASLGAVDLPTERPVGGAPEDKSISFPPSHLLSFPIRVPPGLFAKRWILFYTSDNPPGGCIGSMVLGYTASGKRERVAVSFKAQASGWQSTACDIPAAQGAH